ncbi:MAG: amidohydrolase family protein [Planctomycetaceae bacterium]|nr:amidohydrolase family protein [Planctomycetaceae bacterium]
MNAFQRNLQSLATLFALVASTMPVLASDVIPGAPQKKPIALINGVIHTIVGTPIEGGIVFENGRITEIGTTPDVPADAEVIDLKGRHVYPSLIESHSQLGLTEFGAVRATHDYAEAGRINPNVTANVAVNPDSELIPVTRSNGVLIALSAPSSGLVSGKASVLQLDGWTYEDLTLKANAAMVVNWPRMGSSRSSRSNSDESPLKELKDLFEDARAWKKARLAGSDSQAYDIRLEAMEPVLDRSIPMLVSANRALEIQSAVAFAVAENVRLIIFGGADAEQCAELLKQHDVPVIIDAVHRNPMRRHEDYDDAYTLPARLQKAGVRFCISGSGRSETWNTRNLAYHAATASAYGLSYEDAVRSVTIWPAEILEVADRVGSLEKGKDATLFVSDGDPLETETQVSMAWVQGRKVDLNDRHKQLYQKYSEKYRQLKNAGH